MAGESARKAAEGAPGCLCSRALSDPATQRVSPPQEAPRAVLGIPQMLRGREVIPSLPCSSHMTWTETVRKAGASEISSAVLRFILVYSTPIGELNCFNFSTAQFSALLRLTAMHSVTCWPCPCLRRPHDRAHSRQKTLLAWRKSNEEVADTTCK